MTIGSLRNIGNQKEGTYLVQFPPIDNKAVCRFQNTSGADLLISKLHGSWGISPSSTVHIKGVIYSDNNGIPDQLLATSNELIGLFNNWNTFIFTTPLLIQKDTFVWFGVIANEMLYGYPCLNVGEIKYNSNSYGLGPTSSFGTSNSAPYTYRMFLEGHDGTLSFGRRSIDINGINIDDGNYQPDREHAEKFTLSGTEFVNIESISTYIRNYSTTAKSKAAIYSDNAGYPGSLIAQSEELTGTVANEWLTLAVPGGAFIAPGIYWLAFIASENLQTPVIQFSGNLIVDGPILEVDAFPSSYPPFSGYPQQIIDPVLDGRGIDIYASFTYQIPLAINITRPQVCVSV